MFPHRPPLGHTNSEAGWKLTYLRKNALLNAAVSLLVLLASLFVHVPDFRFVLAGTAIGVCSYFAWSNHNLIQRFVWLVPVVLVPGVWLAVEFSSGATKAAGLIQLMSTVFAALSACFVVERFRGTNPTPRSPDEA
jgi:hypothetical protein